MNAEKFDGKELLEQADLSGRVYPMKGSWRRMQVFAGVCCCLLILTIPLGIWIIVSARKARIGLTEEGFAFKYLTTVAHKWSDIESINVTGMSGAMFGGGLVGMAAAAAVSRKTQGLKGPLQVKLRDKRVPVMIPAQMIENSLEMTRQMEGLSGLIILPTGQITND